MRVLLTGGSGFIAAHCVDYLLQGGHSVVFTVRSDEKGQKILSNHPNVSESQLSYVIVKDIAQENAFDDAVKSDPPFEAVLHTASPFHFNVKDNKKDLLDPAIMGTTGILKSIKKSAPTVKRVAITSSFASILSSPKHEAFYDESKWNGITYDEAVNGDAAAAYRGSKKLAEQAAWDFVEKEKPNFQISTICPPLVLGPVVHYFNSLDAINTSNQAIRDMVQGKMKEKITAARVLIWVDVRDVALAHVRAVETPEAAGKRFFCTAGFFSNGDIANIIKKNFPNLANQLPEHVESDLPNPLPFEIDTSRSREVLRLNYRPLEACVVDTVNSMLKAGA